MVCPNPHGNPAFLAEINQGREPLADPIQLGSVLFIRVFANDEFFGIRVIARIDPYFFHPFRSFHCRFWFEMNISDEWHITAAFSQTLDYVLEITRVLHSWRCDPNDFATCV